MNWSTIYITGRPGFQQELRRKLEHADLECMPGYVDNSTADVSHDLYWLDEKTDLRELKEAIGSKLVWKYRLHFYASLEAFLVAQERGKSTDLSKDEIDLIAHMREVA
jgi:hypothetical protein